jgi:hypothetical protein
MKEKLRPPSSSHWALARMLISSSVSKQSETKDGQTQKKNIQTTAKLLPDSNQHIFYVTSHL